MSTMVPGLSARHDQYGRPLDDTTRRGLEIYEGRLRALLEPAHYGEVVAIHIDSGEHTVAPNSPEAMRAMRAIHPTGLLFLYTIGSTTDHGLALRMMGLVPGTPRK